MPDAERKKALQVRLPEKTDVMAKMLVNSECDYHLPVSELIVGEICLHDTGSAREHALATIATTRSRECRSCSKEGPHRSRMLAQQQT